MKQPTITAADLFCGAGGTSTGLQLACDRLGYRLDLMAINHWDIAIQTHSANHPHARHMCASLDSLNPRDYFAEDQLDLLWASPECTHHSIARGGKPINDQSRATAWCVVRWAEALRPRIIMVENVPEFLTWGAIDSKGKPMKSKKGAVFVAWVESLKALGYRVDWKILCAADYGDPTTRKRLFVQCVRGRRKITWPEPTHAKAHTNTTFLPDLQPWRGAKEIIDWQLPSQSIFKRQRPLSQKTLDRILAGLRKYGVSPYVVSWDHQSGTGHTSAAAPLSTITTKARHGVVQPMLLPQNSGADARPVTDPAPTITTTSRGIGLVEPFLVELRGKSTYKSTKEPLSVVTCSGAHHGLVEPFLVSYYGNGDALSINDPMDTVTTKDRFGLVQPTVLIDGKQYLLDIHFRMLQPHELAGAQGFPRNYQFAGGKTHAVKQIGNAVPVNLASALCAAVLSSAPARGTQSAEGYQPSSVSSAKSADKKSPTKGTRPNV